MNVGVIQAVGVIKVADETKAADEMKVVAMRAAVEAVVKATPAVDASDLKVVDVLANAIKVDDRGAHLRCQHRDSPQLSTLP
jgi:hypothetical protein